MRYLLGLQLQVTQKLQRVNAFTHPLFEKRLCGAPKVQIRVELAALSTEDFQRILTEPDASLTEQYQALLATEGLQLAFTDDGIEKIAQTAWHVNEKTENIGARRLHTVMERLLDEASFGAADAGLQDTPLLIDADYVDSQLQALSADEDLSREAAKCPDTKEHLEDACQPAPGSSSCAHGLPRTR